MNSVTKKDFSKKRFSNIVNILKNMFGNGDLVTDDDIIDRYANSNTENSKIAQALQQSLLDINSRTDAKQKEDREDLENKYKVDISKGPHIKNSSFQNSKAKSKDNDSELLK